MSKLVAFGCSCTFGEALNDCIITDYNTATPSESAWPSVLSKLLKITCDNRSRPGSSNFQILDTILSTNIDKDDVVVVMWSYFGRDMIIDDSGNKYGFHATETSELVNAWATVHGLTDLMYRSWVYIHHAHLYLKSIGVKFYFSNVNYESKFVKLKPNWAQDIVFLDTYMGRYASTNPKATDKMHPGERAHALTAYSMYSDIKLLNNTK
jgi:hypothetical protein